ncbi:response regulator transcription factor [Solibacillus sp. MA9]|uniref:Response regulator transcription factor n=1 Tax=Solibacillus palustris TaxID=2908203 RepID=A0ABS9UBU7_9BACL|nr:response regulator transcription factor [Solibacillus sp. MA9]MCH7321826.1 response regulator transcription factor [Solibacillus sp. MA9]
MTKKILVVEDDENLGNLLQLYLIKDGYEVRIETSGKLGLDALVQYEPDAIILDWTLPDIEGIEICRQIRYQSDIPIIMISSRTDELDAVLALEMGATEYIRKPFGFRELLTRLRLHLKRYEKEQQQQVRVSELVIGPFKVDLVMFKVYKEEVEIPLTKREFKLLLHLLEQPGDIKSREDIIEMLDFTKGDKRTVDVHIRRLREKIEEQPSSPKWIKTKSGIGYYFNDKAQEVSYNS